MSDKLYVDVAAVFSKTGELRPMWIIWKDGQKYTVDRISDIRPAASLKAGGFGIRYVCRIAGKDTHLYYEQDKWFVDLDSLRS
ncbi:MAG: hypothetical protein AB9835_00475 [Eubacteriales bacterium]